MGELQRHRADLGPPALTAQRFLRAIEDAVAAPHDQARHIAATRFLLEPALLDRLERIAHAPEPLDDADLRWLQNALPELVRHVARISA